MMSMLSAYAVKRLLTWSWSQVGHGWLLPGDLWRKGHSEGLKKNLQNVWKVVEAQVKRRASVSLAVWQCTAGSRREKKILSQIKECELKGTFWTCGLTWLCGLAQGFHAPAKLRVLETLQRFGFICVALCRLRGKKAKKKRPFNL